MYALTNPVARILFALPFAIFGILHFMNAPDMAGLPPVPGGVFWVYLTGLIMLVASICIMIEWQVRMAGVVLGLMLLVFVLTLHLPGVLNAPDAMTMQRSMNALLKDTALAGGAWFIAGRYNGYNNTRRDTNDPAV